MDCDTSLHQSRILVVDDTLENCGLLKVVLEKQGYEVLLAHTGPHALEVLDETLPDLILLDVMLPQMNGFEVCQTLKSSAEHKDIPVIFMTALGDVEDKVRAFSVGAMDYLVKPFVIPEVLARVKVHLQLRAALRQLKTQAVTDPLTGAYNRRFAFEVLEKSLQRNERRPETTLVCYLDINGLKEVNDRLGHLEGDRLIKTIAEEVQHEIRASDYLCRVGGDEFLLIMFDGDLKHASPLMDRVAERLARRDDWAITPRFSYGCVVHRPEEPPICAADLVARADAAMYQMKDQLAQSEQVL